MKKAKQFGITQPPQIWCEDCYVRIAPYEDFVTHKNRKLHRQCFQKSERRTAPPPLARTQLDAVTA